MAAFSKGLIIGSDKGDFGMWIKDEDPNKFFEKKIGDEEKYELVYLQSWTSERARGDNLSRSGVTSIDISANDELMAVAFNDNDIATFALGKIIPPLNEGLSVMKKNLKKIEKKIKFEYIFG